MYFLCGCLFVKTNDFDQVYYKKLFILIEILLKSAGKESPTTKSPVKKFQRNKGPRIEFW